jgi:hypothetical protein
MNKRKRFTQAGYGVAGIFQETFFNKMMPLFD